jgi:hypothetical protein
MNPTQQTKQAECQLQTVLYNMLFRNDLYPNIKFHNFLEHGKSVKSSDDLTGIYQTPHIA